MVRSNEFEMVRREIEEDVEQARKEECIDLGDLSVVDDCDPGERVTYST